MFGQILSSVTGLATSWLDEYLQRYRSTLSLRLVSDAHDAALKGFM